MRERSDRILVASRHGGYPTPAMASRRRLCRKPRPAALEHGNERCTGSFDAHGPVPTQGPATTRRFALGAILVDRLAPWRRHEHGLDRRVGRKPALEAT